MYGFALTLTNLSLDNNKPVSTNKSTARVWTSVHMREQQHKTIRILKNMENHVLGFFMKNILFYTYLGIVKYSYTV